MVKIYEFYYDTKENIVCRTEYISPEGYLSGGYHVYDQEDKYSKFILESKIEVANSDIVKCEEDGSLHEIIYVYSLKDDVNNALKIIKEGIEKNIINKKKSMDELKVKINKLNNIYTTFINEQERIKKLYPNGKKR